MRNNYGRMLNIMHFHNWDMKYDFMIANFSRFPSLNGSGALKPSGNHWVRADAFPDVYAFNALAPGIIERNFTGVIFKLILAIDGWSTSGEIALSWMSMDLVDDKSTFVQVMVWCRQTTSHYLNQCWQSSKTPFGVTRPQWVNSVHVSRL